MLFIRPCSMVFLWLLIVIGVFCPVFTCASDGVMHDLLSDQRNYYSKDRLLRLGFAFSGGAILANTFFDEEIQSHYQDRMRSKKTDDFSKHARFFGERDYIIPISLALASLSLVEEDSLIGEFGSKTARSYFVGGIPVFAMQRITGAGRPEEHDHGSEWRPLDDSNGVSGHAFIGAVPFIVAARMNDNIFIRYALYAASLATPFSRVNDNAHFASQAVLGWYMAYEAVGAVHGRESNKSIAVAPVVDRDYYGLTVSVSWK
ncbi:phosphatase PAP2 family protein [Desulfobotulus mexicanus]|uniref:Phosphatase PAP2 family protein n=1 Tax=Desulfobotulus mexicanus TaxID=2586642 RepID=A0A5S5MCB9_9BACT|nr:phosphatase PAP2 family protein [Desulfobotulus mexicanus]TYT73378.1 phosphatase PAP2 family protein [Desulfobotulus mexicanus]